MHVHWPQAILLFLLTARVAIHIDRHGETKPVTKYEAGLAVFNYGITVGLLVWGGFFNG
jgi:hypothetical protein